MNYIARFACVASASFVIAACTAAPAAPPPPAAAKTPEISPVDRGKYIVNTAGCHDCHIPHDYPYLLVYKAKAGIKDAIGEMRGVIDTEEKFNKERLNMAKHVWEEYQGNNSRACRHCHQFSKEVIAKQKEEVRPIHEAVLAGNGTCVDCHKGVGHKAPVE